jgi:hypothetical protein
VCDQANISFSVLFSTILGLIILPGCSQVSVITDNSQTISSPLLVQAKAPPNVPKVKSSISKNLFNWRNVNIQGMGYVTGLIISPVAPYDVYVRTDVGGIYRFNRGNNSWIPLMDMFDTNFAMGGVGVESLALDSTKPNRIYAAIKSKNSDFQDKDNKVKSKYAGEVLVSENKGLSWKSTSLGKHNIYVGPNEAYRAETGERLAVDPHQSGLIYFASRRHGLWRKQGNADWVRVAGGLPEPSSLPGYKNADGTDNKDLPGFTFVAFDQRTGDKKKATQTIYMGIHGSGIWRSRDAGKSWENIGGSDNPLRGVVANDGTLYVGFGTLGNDGKGKKATGSIRKYQKNSWSDITPDGERVYPAVTVQQNQAYTVMAIADKFVYRSTNGGKSWSKQTMFMGAYDPNHPQDKVNSSAPGYYQSYASTGAASIMIDSGNPKQVWWTNGMGVARTDDVTKATPYYKWLMNNLEELDSNMVRVPPKSKALGGADLLSAVQDKIGFRHISRNQVPTKAISPSNVPINPAFKWANPDWKVYPQPYPHVAGATGMDYAYKNPDYVAFVGFNQWQGFWGIHGISSDNGKTWKAFESVPTETLWKSDKSAQEKVMATGGQIAMSPTNPKNLVWSPTWGTWTHYTKDGGKTWQLSRNIDRKPMPQPFDPQNNDHNHYDALPKSWSNTINPWLSSYILAADRQDPKGETFYYLNNSTFYYSNDGGANWRESTAKLPGWLIRPTIVPNPTQQGDVWVSFARNPEEVTGNKLYRSIDGGKTFTIVTSVKSCEYITFGKGSSSKNPYIYIFGKIGNAKKDAIYKSENMGKSWIQISDPNVLMFPGMVNIEGDMRSLNLVYVALTGRGIMVGEK